jgi:hypothetical protein
MASRERVNKASAGRTAQAEKPLKQIAGYAGAAPEVRENPNGEEFTTFRVGVNLYYDDERDDSTKWYGVAVNKPAVQDWVLENVKTGTPIVVEGTASKTEKDGNVYFNMTGYKVGLVDWFVSGPDTSVDDDDEL